MLAYPYLLVVTGAQNLMRDLFKGSGARAGKPYGRRPWHLVHGMFKCLLKMLDIVMGMDFMDVCPCYGLTTVDRTNLN
jgi:hypothetical protein